MKTHGLKGEVTFALAPDCPELEDIESVFLQVRNQLVPYFIHSISIKGTKAYVKLEDVNSAEEAEALTGCSLYLPRESRPALPRGEFYSDEIIDFEVIDKDFGLLGRVREVQELGITRHLIVVQEKKEIMIPVNGPFIQGVNKSKKRINVELPEGFLDL
ncbi:MAG: 16S rRNA processing protein RimM [Cyclobacteriaceae bacterium]|nr:16S rRNA processing protein RimM [Cyclobacteriaceae bacterium]